MTRSRSTPETSSKKLVVLKRSEKFSSNKNMVKIIEKNKDGQRLAGLRWKNATPEEKEAQLKKMARGKKRFWSKLTPEERSKRMKMVRAQTKHAEAPSK